jgi:hypothetical protein
MQQQCHQTEHHQITEFAAQSPLSLQYIPYNSKIPIRYTHKIESYKLNYHLHKSLSPFYDSSFYFYSTYSYFQFAYQNFIRSLIDTN